MSSRSTDEGSATIQYYRVRAYLKVETKAIVESASKCFTQHFESKLGNQLLTMLHTTSDELVGLVKEPYGMKEERETLKRRKTAVKQAIDILSL